MKGKFVAAKARVGLALSYLAVGILISLGASVVRAQAPGQETFSSPESAMHALIQAVNSKDRAELGKIFGPEYKDLLSGDPVEDDKDLADFDAGLQQSAQLQKQNDTAYTLLVGENKWPFPVPIETEHDNLWMFDTKDGLQQILDRRIGENELSAIATARAYVVAQWQYFTNDDWGHDGVCAYAQKFVSSPGEHDGLYWETAEGDPPSPFGPLVAEARSEGYGPQNHAASASDASTSGTSTENTTATSGGHHPFHGYFFKILTRQGPHAPGGRYNYIINGNMIAGFALIAYPDKWGNSGVMTFIVNQQGRVYEKNLGPNTDKVAAAITEYDPDTTWKMVDWQPGAPAAPAAATQSNSRN
ncbi:MAG TPA: DUF2950 domain-containing protein [Candidatus Acidoferrales bacterium]|nr:DUF2950 domain-containing protein [Candidatus Acidoferrales bacterium]